MTELKKRTESKGALNPHIKFCIVCRKSFEIVEPSVEHIIPEALGNGKITTCCVCETCNNQLGTRVDAYLTDHIFVKFIRQQKLPKDKNIQLFDSTLFEKGTNNKYKVFNDHAEVITQVLKSEDIEGGGVHLKIGAKSLEEGLEKAKRKIKRLRSDWSDEDIEKAINREGAIIWHETEYIQPTLQQDADLDQARWMIEAIKIGYEYTCEKIGEPYTEDKIAEKYSHWLYQAVKGKKKYSQEEYKEIGRYCNLFDKRLLSILDKKLIFGKYGDPKYIIVLCGDAENKMVCHIRILDEDILTFTVLMSENASMYLWSKGIYGSMIFEDDNFIDF